MIRTTATLYVRVGRPEGRLKGHRLWAESRHTYREVTAFCRRCCAAWTVETDRRKSWPALAQEAVAGLRRAFPSCDEELARRVLNS